MRTRKRCGVCSAFVLITIFFYFQYKMTQNSAEDIERDRVVLRRAVLPAKNIEFRPNSVNKNKVLKVIPISEKEVGTQIIDVTKPKSKPPRKR